GSTYIQDPSLPASPGGGASSGSAAGRIGALPEPLPLPVGPSVPLASGSDKRDASGGTRSPQASANNGPSVKVFDEIEHVCKANETFESLSKQYFVGSPNYAKALQRHNQNHSRASKQMQTTGELTPGEKIYIPRAYILEERYADTIPKPASVTSSPTVPATFVAPSASQPPLAPTSPSPGQNP
ncbi:MAG: hypothetical protein ACRELG_03305, partial [Gemmataceae bacterium]